MKKENVLVIIWAIVFIISSVSLVFSFRKARVSGDYFSLVGFLIPTALSLFILVGQMLRRRMARVRGE
jgi:hypothetical protein